MLPLIALSFPYLLLTNYFSTLFVENNQDTGNVTITSLTETTGPVAWIMGIEDNIINLDLSLAQVAFYNGAVSFVFILF
jgi:hypothetical protein